MTPLDRPSLRTRATILPFPQIMIPGPLALLLTMLATAGVAGPLPVEEGSRSAVQLQELARATLEQASNPTDMNARTGLRHLYARVRSGYVVHMFQREFKGIPIRGSRGHVVFDAQTGKKLRWRMDDLEPLAPELVPTTPPPSAGAVVGVGWDWARSPQLEILRRGEAGPAARLAWVATATNEGGEERLAIVDASSGGLLTLRDVTARSTISGTCEAQLREDGVCDPVMGPLALPGVEIRDPGGVVTHADAAGQFELDPGGNFPVELTSFLRNPSLEVRHWDDSAGDFVASEASVVASAPGPGALVQWDDTNSLESERAGYLHVDRIMSWAQTTFDDFDFLPQAQQLSNQRVLVNTNKAVIIGTGGTYAWRDTDGLDVITTYRAGVAAGEPYEDAGLIPGLYYHEYAHGLVQRAYDALGFNGAVPSGLTESIPDVIAALFDDDSVALRGLYQDPTDAPACDSQGPNDSCNCGDRQLDNNLLYPGDLVETGHDAMERQAAYFVGGYYWEAYEELSTILGSKELARDILARNCIDALVAGTPQDIPEFIYWSLLLAHDPSAAACSSTPNLVEATLQRAAAAKGFTDQILCNATRFAAASPSVLDLDAPGDPASSISWNDFDLDGDLDLLVCGASSNRLFRNDAGSLIELSTPGLDGVYGALGSWGDANNDGKADLFLATPGGATRLAEGDGSGGFVAHQQGGLQGYVGIQSVSWVDYDSDGLLDIFLSGPSVMLQNQGAFQFQEVLPGATGSPGSLDAAWADFDLDGDPDAYLAHGPGVPNELLRNLGGSFELVSAAPLGNENTCHSVEWVDANSDGLLDILALYELEFGTSPMAFSSVELLLNQGGSGSFTHSSGGGILDRTYSRLATTGDYDGDGMEDLFASGGLVETAGKVRLLRTSSPAQYEDATAWHTGLANLGGAAGFGDFDGDGDLDLMTTGNVPGAAEHQLFENLSANPAEWIQVRLEGTTSNRMGIGSVVVLSRPGAPPQARHIDGGNARSQNAAIAHFRVPNGVASVDIDVYWSGGQSEHWAGLATGLSHTLTQGTAPPSSPNCPPRGPCIGEAPTKATRVQLLPPNPNPSNASTSMAVDLPASAEIRLEIFDSRGRRVRLLHTGPTGAGRHEYHWDGRGEAGQLAASGIYRAILSVAGRVEATRNLVLLK